MTRNKKKPQPTRDRRSTDQAKARPGDATASVEIATDADGSAADAGVVSPGDGDTPTMSGDLTARASLRGVRLALVGLAFAGFLISFYLTLTHYRNLIPPCYGATGCETVITSRYAVLAGIPLSLVGAVFFAGMFYLGIALLTNPNRKVLVAYELLAYAGLLVAIGLFLLQALVLDAYCTYCLTTEVIAFLMWGGSFLLTSSARRSA